MHEPGEGDRRAPCYHPGFAPGEISTTVENIVENLRNLICTRRKRPIFRRLHGGEGLRGPSDRCFFAVISVKTVSFRRVNQAKVFRPSLCDL